MILQKVISGGQTGLDMAGLDAALECNIPTGGTAAYQFRQSVDKGKNIHNHELADKYGLKSGNREYVQGFYGPYFDVYSHRTEENVKDSDGTIWFGNKNSPGGKLTLKLCDNNQSPCFVNPESVEQIVKWIIEEDIKVLNIAGNREWTNPGIYDKAKNMLVETFKTLQDET